ncbi:MAG: MmgE/PrpD family protein [Chloroflexi bacterium]|nr:MmgE/PrpD family protein [Chloroflexota bacterium]
MDAAVAMAHNAVRIQYADLPNEAVEATKKDILDTLGTAVAGSAAPGEPQIVELVKEFAGKEEATVLVYGGKIPAIEAAMANASMGHALDYDDTHDGALLHAGVTAVPAAFATAERIGKVNGKDFIAAVALGVDVICRMGLANPEGPAGWILTPVYGFFGAAVAAGKLLGLDKDTMVSGMGIAYAQAAGNNLCVDDGALTKRMQAGFAARGGIMAALMAQKGIIGTTNSLEARRGLYNVYHNGNYMPAPLTDRLGTFFEVSNLSFKPYPCCRANHPSIDATLAIRKEHPVTPDEVEEITVFVNTQPNPHLLFEPIDVKRNPRTIVDAQFSIPYTVACALVRGKVSISDFTEPAIRDRRVIGVANKVAPVFDKSMDRRELTPARVEVKTRNATYSKYIDRAYGHPDNPMPIDVIGEKFRDCARNAASPIAPDKVERVIELASRLEELDDVTEIMRLLG